MTTLDKMLETSRATHYSLPELQRAALRIQEAMGPEVFTEETLRAYAEVAKYTRSRRLGTFLTKVIGTSKSISSADKV